MHQLFGSRLLAGLAIAWLATAGSAYAQADEIQVYDGGLAKPGIFNLTFHANITPRGVATPAFPGAVVADKSLNAVPEWALGVNDWFEIGFYAPLVSRDQHTGWGVDGVKLRTLFAVPKADERTFFYGANVEFSFNAKRWDPTRFTSEVRPIVGWHLNRVDLIFNPIIDTAYDGIKNLEFVPAVRVAYNVSPAWAIALEEYADIGPLRRFHAARDQAHMLYGVVSHSGKRIDVEAGIGVGLTPSSDKLTFKLILATDLNRRP